MNKSKLLAVSLMVAVLGFGPTARAQSVIYDNLSGTTFGVAGVGWEAGMMPWDPAVNKAWATSFTTGAENWTLQSVTLWLDQGSLSAGGFAAHLYSDNEGQPGAQLTTLVGNDNPTAGLNSYSGAFDMNPNTTYWLEADVTTANSVYGWWVSDEQIAVGSAIGSAYSNDGGPWVIFGGNYNFLMQVSATPTGVPEPSSMALAGLGIAALLIFRRRQ